MAGNMLIEGTLDTLPEGEEVIWAFTSSPVNSVPYYYVLVAYDSYQARDAQFSGVFPTGIGAFKLPERSRQRRAHAGLSPNLLWG